MYGRLVLVPFEEINSKLRSVLLSETGHVNSKRGRMVQSLKLKAETLFAVDLEGKKLH